MLKSHRFLLVPGLFKQRQQQVETWQGPKGASKREEEESYDTWWLSNLILLAQRGQAKTRKGSRMTPGASQGWPCWPKGPSKRKKGESYDTWGLSNSILLAQRGQRRKTKGNHCYTWGLSGLSLLVQRGIARERQGVI